MREEFIRLRENAGQKTSSKEWINHREMGLFFLEIRSVSRVTENLQIPAPYSPELVCPFVIKMFITETQIISWKL